MTTVKPGAEINGHDPAGIVAVDVADVINQLLIGLAIWLVILLGLIGAVIWLSILIRAPAFHGWTAWIAVASGLVAVALVISILVLRSIINWDPVRSLPSPAPLAIVALTFPATTTMMYWLVGLLPSQRHREKTHHTRQPHHSAHAR